MLARTWRFFAAASLLCALSLLSAPAGAAITIGGDPYAVSPDDPTTWTSSTTIDIGFGAGSTGTVTVTGGSSLTCGCVAGMAAGSFGVITVDGSGSKWTNNGQMILGYAGSGTLNVQNKGKVTSGYSNLGYFNSGSSGTATVTGTGSTWTNSSLLIGYGYDGGKGTLTVSSGGQVITNSFATIAGGVGLASSATVTGTGSAWTTASLSVDPFSTLTVASGGKITTGSLTAPLANLKGNGTITTKGLVTDIDLVFDAAHGTSQVFSFGTGGVLNLNQDSTGALGAGWGGTGSLRIAEGVKITSAGGYLGYNAGSTGAATVTGTGSTWTSSSVLYVGREGSGTLTVDQGGTVTTGTLYASASSLIGDGTINAASLVSDMDLVFDAAHGTSQVLSFGTGGTLNLDRSVGGDLGAANLRIADGQKITSPEGYLGYYPGKAGAAIITGAGSSWTNGTLFVGYAGASTLTVENGATLSSNLSWTGSYLGYNPGSSGTVNITGPGSTWTNAAEFNAGTNGAGTLNVTGGGTVSNTAGYLGRYSGSAGTATVTGPGSAWTNSGSLYVGASGSGTLSVTGGGKVTSVGGYLGQDAGASGAVTISDPGSAWINTGTLYVCNNGTGTLTVQNGGTVTTGTLYAAAADLHGDGTINTKGLVSDFDLVYDATHGTSQALPFGAGGTLNLNLNGTGDLGLGARAAGSLRVADGVKITSLASYLGYNAGSGGTATVTDTGSTWTTSGTLYVGYNGSGTLSVTHGGRVVNGSVSSYSNDSQVGYNAGSVGTVTVTGAGSTWVNNCIMNVGDIGTGTVTVSDGGTVSSRGSTLGNDQHASGTVTVTGQGAAWTDTGTLEVGYSGVGVLNVTGGGKVSSSVAYIGWKGTVTVTGPGSTWTNSGKLGVSSADTSALTVADGGVVTTGTLSGDLGNLKGNGTINAKGIISDMALVFDATHGSNQAFAFGSGGTLNLNLDGTGALGVGYAGTGSLRVADGAKIYSAGGTVGSSGSGVAHGTAVITGPGSTWYFKDSLSVGGPGTLRVENGGTVSTSALYGRGYIGGSSSGNGRAVITGPGSSLVLGYGSTLNVGNGTLRVENGGAVSDYDGNIGDTLGTSGAVVVSGAGSTWSNQLYLDLGANGTGMLTIGSGGKVTAYGLRIYYPSTVNLHVSGNGMLAVGSGGITNTSGTINVAADAFLAAGTYTPITTSAAVFCVGFGGPWNMAAGTLTVTPATTTAAGVTNYPVTFQRLLITDPDTGKRAGASFAYVGGGTNFRADLLSGSTLTGLPADQTVLGAWNFTTNFATYFPGGQALLSFDIGAGQTGDLSVWHYDGSTWTPFAAPDLTYGSDGIADFAVADFGGYAVTVPEPVSMTLLVLGGLALLRRRR